MATRGDCSSDGSLERMNEADSVALVKMADEGFGDGSVTAAIFEGFSILKSSGNVGCRFWGRLGFDVSMSHEVG